MPAVPEQSILLNYTDWLSFLTLDYYSTVLSHITYYAYCSRQVIYLLLYVQLCRVHYIMPAVLKQSNLLNNTGWLSFNTRYYYSTVLPYIIYYAHNSRQVIYLLLYVQLCRIQSIMPAVLKQSNLLNDTDQPSLNTRLHNFLIYNWLL